MGLETATSISALNALWPLGTDTRSQGDDHLRLIKSVLKSDVPSKAAGSNAMTGSLQANLFSVERNGAPTNVHFRTGGPLQTGMYSFTAQNAVYFAILGAEAARLEPAGLGVAADTGVITKEKGDARYVMGVRLNGYFALDAAGASSWRDAPAGGVVNSVYAGASNVTGARGMFLQALINGTWTTITGSQ